MPRKNHFQHQAYSSEKPLGEYELLNAPFPAQRGTDEFRRTLVPAAELIASEVDVVYLIHGTFAGNDALGWTAQIERLWPTAAEHIREIGKKIVDVLADDMGNFTNEYSKELESLLNAKAIESVDGESADENQAGDKTTNHSSTGLITTGGLIKPAADDWLPVRRFHWSGENNHVGRSIAAIDLLDELLDRCSSEQRVLLLCHSHAGNVLAIVTNLLGAEAGHREKFLDIVSSVFRDEKEKARMARVRERLADAEVRSRLRLDIATMGTPIRYGWDNGGFQNLLHFVNHVPRDGDPDFASPVPDLKAKNLLQIDGDFVQQFGIAGTNLLPYVLDLRLMMTEQKLNTLLQPFGRDNFWEHLKMGVRVAHEGKTLLVNYDDTDRLSQQLAGHGVYTQIEWLAFHIREIGHRFYLGSSSANQAKR